MGCTETDLPPNPFNPGAPIDPREFIGRSVELENFRQKLRQTMSGSLASMAVTGGYGVGKTSFIHKCKEIAEAEGALTVYFSLNIMNEPNKLSLSSALVNRLHKRIEEEFLLKRISSKLWQILDHIIINIPFLTIKGTGTNPLDLELDLYLNKIWTELKKEKKAIVFLIDEARALEKNKAELLSYLRAVLEQLSIDHVPVMFVPAGNSSFGPSGTGFSPLVRTFPPTLLEKFMRMEANLFIKRKLDNIGIKIDERLFDMIYDKTEGHPFVLCSYMASAYSKLRNGERKMTAAHFSAADLDFVSSVLAPFFARFYDHTGKTSKKILWTMAERNGEINLSTLSQVLGYDNNELSPHLGNLIQEGAIVRLDRGVYRLFHHLLGEYIKQQPSNGTTTGFKGKKSRALNMLFL